uniref:Nucleoporin NUP35 n=1 Tax=Panagrellus redivivus TaxID=6233 RepID=A0A7E5A007_PANRE
MQTPGSNYSYNGSQASLNRRNTFGGSDNQQRPPLRGRRQIYLASTPIPAGDLRLRALHNQGFNSPGVGQNASVAMSTTNGNNSSNSLLRSDNKSPPVDSRLVPVSQISMGGERYCKEYLFGNVAERNALKNKANAENDQSRRKVSFSPDLPRREPVERTPSRLKYLEQSRDIFTSRRLNESVNNDSKTKVEAGRSGPPLRFLRDTRPQIKRPRLDDVATPESRTVEDPDEEDFWVTVFGFSPSYQEDVLELFGRHGTIVKHDVPRPGNWILIRYSTIVHVQQALERNGHLLAPGVMIGVVPTRNLNKINQSNDGPRHAITRSSPPGSESTQSRLVPDPTPSTPRPRPSLSNGSSNLPIGMRSIGYNFRPLEEEATTGSPGLMDRILSVFK